MGKFFRLIASILGLVLNWIYENISFHNYGLAIVIFTIMIHLLLWPSMVKQHKMKEKMKVIQPKLDELKKKYGNDMQKYYIESAKLNQEVGLNQTTGCLSALCQLPVIWSLFYVVAQPLTYMKGMTAEEIARWISLVPMEERLTGMYEQIPAVAHNNLLNMNFLGMNLASIPKLEFNLLLLLPILVTIITYLSAKVRMSNEVVNNEMKKTTNYFLIVEPIIMLMFSFKVPASLCVFWITRSLIQMVEQWYLNEYIKDTGEVNVNDVVS